MNIGGVAVTETCPTCGSAVTIQGDRMTHWYAPDVSQRGIVAFVADRGYLDGYTLDQRIARQLVKELKELCEALQCIQTDEGALYDLVFDAGNLGKFARAVFDVPSFFDDVRIEVPVLLDELPDLAVPLAVLADAVGVDLMAAGLEKARADVARGVRNGTAS